MPDDGYTLTRHDGERTVAMLDEIAEVYVPAYAEPPYEPHPMFSREEFIPRTTRQTTRKGFTLIGVRKGDGELVGFSFGLHFVAGSWWRDVSGSAPPQEIVDAAKFSVIELVVAAPHRGRGLARRLLGALLDGRPEQYAMLLAQPDSHARTIYAHWGWKQVAVVQSYPGGDIDDVLVLSL
ncbi:GNAT family N-acetyltransferase [Actinomadura darangshiensis]|uniref:GNAT family N-acetyltransferase n=1 Tax=Actinomadura darangshiensis TaxID=705336 RepID=A0A4R5AKM2_9ACTN|nr:GNAT family N-acetyltransferase [Actinomadura darangshiensis]TDD72116.1 GNAT family N-acetyltransferase [Actinomadura darangshiensis]